MKLALGYAAAAGLIGTVLAANWAITRFGPVPVGFGLVAPAGVYFAGLAFVLRDVVHETLGRLAVVACIIAGASLSWGVSPAFALASAAAFGVSELLDFLTYDRLRNRIGVLRAAASSNVVGALVDSWLFLTLAFGSLEYFAGQAIGKLWIGALGALASALVIDRVRAPQALTA